MRVLKIDIPREKIANMPSDARAFFLSLGYAANQLSFMIKLVMFSSNGPSGDDVQSLLSAAQTQMLLRLSVGTINEFWELISKSFFRSGLSKIHSDHLDPD